MSSSSSSIITLVEDGLSGDMGKVILVVVVTVVFYILQTPPNCLVA